MALRSQKDITAYGEDERLLEDAAKLKATKESVGESAWDAATDEQKAAMYFDYTGEELRNIRDVERAEALMDQEMPEGRETGGIYVAANPLEFAGKLANSYVGGKQRRDAVSKQEELSKQKQQALMLAGTVAREDAQKQQADYMEVMRGMYPGQEQGGGASVGKQQVTSNQLRQPMQGTPQNTMGVMQGSANPPPQGQGQGLDPMALLSSGWDWMKDQAGAGGRPQTEEEKRRLQMQMMRSYGG